MHHVKWLELWALKTSLCKNLSENNLLKPYAQRN